jgi:hypothetical protein
MTPPLVSWTRHLAAFTDTGTKLNADKFRAAKLPPTSSTTGTAVILALVDAARCRLDLTGHRPLHCELLEVVETAEPREQDAKAGDVIPQGKGRRRRVVNVIEPEADGQLPVLVVEPA